MRNPLELYRDYITQDEERIKKTDLRIDELKKLRRSGWLHQGILAPVFTPLLLLSVIGFSNEATSEGILYGVTSLPFYSMYLRYGFRRQGAAQKLEKLVTPN